MTSTQSNRQNLLLLFDRPTQPIFRPKGLDANLCFDIPNSYYTDRYRPIASSVSVRGPNVNLIPVREFPLPDISLAMRLDKRSNFTTFNDFHRQCATNLINILMSVRTIEEFTSVSCYIQQRVNPFLYIYALSVAMLHRRDTRGIPIPSHVCTFPELYMDSTSLARAREEGALISNGTNRIPIEIPRDYTGTDADVEHRLAYFREDIGINIHHWHWHLIFPLDGPMEIVNKDRRGEMFYYMHQQVMGRYNIERFCNGLSRIAPYSNLRDPIPEAYFPKMDTLVSSRVWPPRPANFYLSNLNRESDQLQVELLDMERWRDRLFEAIHRGFVYRGTDVVPLTELGGIDLLGNMVESSILSVNRNLYGNLHNMGHMVLGYCHDPDNRYLETFSPVGDPTTSMRDPIFYRWHLFINDIFDEHKRTLPPYTTQLNFDGIQVTGIEIRSQSLNVPNVFLTFWQTNQVELSRGLDFVPQGPVFVSFTHLQHDAFSYRITVQNNGNRRTGTVRIFLSPRLNERGVPFLLRDQRHLFIELDKFTATLNSGSNTLTRNSIQSSITVPFEQTFRTLDDRPPDNTLEQDEYNFCGCGWPDHMLLPKGTPGDGYECELFVIITDYETDRVDDPNAPTTRRCDDAVSFCGLRNSRFPDAKPMGFPFDRMPRPGIQILSQFLTPNMGVQRVRIRHENRTVPGVTMNRPTTIQPAQAGQQQGTAARPTQGGANRRG